MSEFAELISNLGGGTFENQIVRALRDVALGVVTNGKKGGVTISFELDQIGDSSQVECKHKLSFVKPTLRGKASEEVTNKTPLHVNREGTCSLFPHETGDMFKKREDIA